MSCGVALGHSRCGFEIVEETRVPLPGEIRSGRPGIFSHSWTT